MTMSREVTPSLKERVRYRYNEGYRLGFGGFNDMVPLGFPKEEAEAFDKGMKHGTVLRQFFRSMGFKVPERGC